MSAAIPTPHLFVIAGHDSSGGAGVDADREAARHFDVELTSVVTAWTRQGEGVVHAIDPSDPAVFQQEIERLFAALRSRPSARAIKIGLLPTRAHVEHVAALLAGVEALHPPVPCVLDPVLRASGGELFLDQDGTDALLAMLLPRGVVVTPNLHEAAALTGAALEELQAEPEARVQAARALCERGAHAVLLKGGHAREDPVRDLVLERDEEPVWHRHPRVRGAAMHGSGCRYASAVAGQLARGVPLVQAARGAGGWVRDLLAAR